MMNKLDSVRSGVLDGHAFFRLGSGRPLLLLPGLSSNHDLPSGSSRSFELREAQRYAASREVWWVQRRAGLATGTTMAQIADHYATLLADRLEGPVDVVGASTGGSVGLQLAADHPHVVRRLALVAAACRLGEAGRRAQRRVAELLRKDQRRRAGAALMSTIGSRAPTKAAMGAVGWLLAPWMLAGEVDDMLVTIDAEDAFDVTGRLSGIEVPTLVVGGARDGFYGAELFRETAEGLPAGRLLLHPDKGHAGTIASGRTIDAVLEHLGG